MSYENAKSKYQTALSSFSMLKGLKSVLVGFSGGADSTLLLTLLAKESGIRVAAAHLNHGIRGEEALRDENFCIDYCKKLGIDIYVKHSDIPDIAKTHGLTVEEAARNERYKFFNEILNKQGYDCIATAHNADDNAETMIFNLVRGASLSGLCGIPPKRGRFIRPLLFCERREIEEYCNRDADKALELIAEKIAVIKLNRINTEGLASQSLSGISESYIDGYPAEITAVLNRKRKIKIV